MVLPPIAITRNAGPDHADCNDFPSRDSSLPPLSDLAMDPVGSTMICVRLGSKEAKNVANHFRMSQFCYTFERSPLTPRPFCRRDFACTNLNLDSLQGSCNATPRQLRACVSRSSCSVLSQLELTRWLRIEPGSKVMARLFSNTVGFYGFHLYFPRMLGHSD